MYFRYIRSYATKRVPLKSWNFPLVSPSWRSCQLSGSGGQPMAEIWWTSQTIIFMHNPLFSHLCSPEIGPTETIIIPQTSYAPIKSVSQATPNGLDGYFSNFSSLHREDGYCVLGFSKFCTNVFLSGQQ